MSEEPKCAYCGCADEDCLAICKQTKLPFCNGKGDTSESHIIHHLKSVKCNEIELLESNPLSSLPLQCFLCGSTDIFRLIFIYSAYLDKYVIVCKDKCQFSDDMKPYLLKIEDQQPLVMDEQLSESIVNIPKPDQYSRVTISDTIPITNQCLAMLSRSPAVDTNVPRMTLTYTSLEEYKNVLLSFIEEEKRENNRFASNKFFEGVEASWDNRRQVTIQATPELYKIAATGSGLKLFSDNLKDIAFVLSKRGSLKITLQFKNNTQLFNTPYLNVSIPKSDTAFDRQAEAVKLFASDDNCCHFYIKQMMLGIKAPRRKNLLADPKPFTAPPSPLPALNRSQLEACQAAMKQHFTLIQGPPGTGKTTVIAAIAHSMISAGISPVLVCCQSNIAADNVSLRVAETGVVTTRVLSNTREPPSYDLKILSDVPLNSAEAVCVTCSVASSTRLMRMTFKAVIFDESGQCLDPDLILGISKGAEQMVVVGDHCQLGPIVLSRSNIRNRYDMPLMQRLVLIGIRPLILRTQYRMHPTISEFASKVFYRGLVDDGITAADRVMSRKIPVWPSEAPLMFWNLPSVEELFGSGSTLVNRVEAETVAQLLVQFYNSGISSSDICVISPYAGMQTYLLGNLPSLASEIAIEWFDDLEIASVDSFQGREKNFVIFTLVRANDQNDIGFLKDSRRLCVSLTRAREGLIVLGRAETFAKNKIWCQFVHHCQKHGCFVEGKIGNLVPSSFTPLVDTSKDADADDNYELDDSDLRFY